MEFLLNCAMCYTLRLMLKTFSLRLSTTLLALILTAATLQGANAQVTEFTMDNGLRIITSESHVEPIVAVDVWVKAGTRREKSGQSGVAHFLEHVIFKGTAAHPDEESVDGAIEDLGGTLDAATSYDWAHFYTEIPATGYPEAIALLADVLQHSALKASSVEDERPIILDEISRNTDDPITSLTDLARSLVYVPGSAYGRPITGSMDDVRAVTRDQIVDFYNTFYVPNNVTIVVSGDVAAADVQKDVIEQFGNWKRSNTVPDDGDAAASAYAVPAIDGSAIHRSLTQKNADESYLVMAFSAPSVTDTPDAWTMDVLLTLLGQGGNNRLNTALKVNQHLVDTVEADYLTQKDPGILTVSASLPTANVNAVETAVLDQVQQLRDTPIGDVELAAAKSALKASYLFDVDTDSGHADSLGFYDSIDSYEYDVDYLDRVAAVTSADLQRIAQTYLNPNAYTVVLQTPPPDVSTASELTDGGKAAVLSDWVSGK